MSDRQDAETERKAFDARRTGWTVEDIVEECHEHGYDPYNQHYYTTYSDVYHTNPECPHIADSERLHYATDVTSLDGYPWATGCFRDAREFDECSWCAGNEPDGRYREDRSIGAAGVRSG